MAASAIGPRLTFLREHVYPLGHHPYTYAELRAMLREDHGVHISVAQLSRLFSGEVADPSFATLSALASIFKVNVSVFSSDPDQWKEVESWVTGVSRQVSLRNLAAARGRRFREQRLAARASNVAHPPLESD